MPFKKGQSGNPNGTKQRKLRQIQELLLPYAEEAVETLVNSMRQKKGGEYAAKDILDRLYGKAPQSVELTGKDGGPVQYERLVDRPAPEVFETWAARTSKALDAPDIVQ